MKVSDQYKLYILIRNDLPSLNAGKAMAQAAHAANQFIHQYGTKSCVRQWQRGRGFGTTIVLSADCRLLMDVLDKAQKKKVISDWVWDETYPLITDKEIASLISDEIQTADTIYKEDGRVVIFRKELTCGYLFVKDGSSNQEELVGVLPLHP